MNKKTKWILIGLLAACIIGLTAFFLSGISPIKSIRKAHNQPVALISLEKQAPEIAADVKLTAHRGVNALAPENSLPAYEKSVELGYYSAECDIKQTADGRWVLYHDPLLYSRFLKLGAVADKDLNTLKTYPYKTGRNFWEYSDIRIPTLEEYLELFVGTQTRPQIEIKTSRYDSLNSVVNAIHQKGLEKSAIIISFDFEQLRQIRELDKDIELWYLVYHINQKKIDAAKVLGNCWLSADCSLNAEKEISLCQAQDVPLSMWTVNSPQKAEKLYSLGVRYMETDILY